jgi:putative endonuclease
MDKLYFVYILTNAWHTVFYTGITSDLVRRVYEHKMKLADGFTKKYNVDKLVYFEQTTDAEAAIHREKIIKKWKRAFKFDAIERMNPEWKDLYNEVAGDPATSAG